MKRLVIFLLLLLIPSSVVSCSREVKMEHCELGITLSRDFEEVSDSDYDVAYSDGELVVGFTRISFAAAANEGIPASLSEIAFARLYADKVGISRDKILEYGEFNYITLKLDNGYRSTEVFLRTPYAYFIVSFVHRDGGGWNLEKTLKLLSDIYLIDN